MSSLESVELQRSDPLPDATGTPSGEPDAQDYSLDLDDVESTQQGEAAATPERRTRPVPPRAPARPVGTTQRVKAWCFTINNYTESDIEQLKQLTVQYIVFQQEVGENGTAHLQGYVEFHSGRTFDRLKRVFPRAHFERRHGTAKQASEYCKKQNTRKPGTQPYESGQISSQGRRTDLEHVRATIQSGATDLDLANQHFALWCVYRHAFADYRRLAGIGKIVRTWKTELIIYWGDTGTGKSRKAHEENPGAYWLPKANGKGTATWWPGYYGQETVIIDDFYCWLPLDTMLHLADRYPMIVRVNTQTDQEFLARKIIITSNSNPRTWYSQYSNQAAFLRRIDKIEHFSSGLN